MKKKKCIHVPQYTLRRVPAAVDLSLRKLAEKEGRSINAVALEVLQRGLELGGHPVEYHDLDGLAGSWVADAEMDWVLADMDKIEPGEWK